MRVNIGLDIGSTSINTVLMDGERNILKSLYHFCHGKPYNVLEEVLEEIIEDGYAVENLALTGTGGKLAAELIGGHYINEIIAQASSVARLYPHARTLIEMGGEDSKLIFLEAGGARSQIADFATNGICAAGTGSFLDQQAKRLGISIEGEFGELALMSENPPRIAGRCSVFAKSDMIHLQQIGTPVHDIVAGLCFAVARNFKSSLARGRELEKPVVFQGGVAANAGVVRAFRELLNLSDGELIIPEHYASMGAIGSLFHILENPPEVGKPFKGLGELKAYLRSEKSQGHTLEPLKDPEVPLVKDVDVNVGAGEALDVYLGVDVGSLSTNVVLVDEKNRVVARRYLATAGRPLDALRRGLEEIYEEVGDRVKVKACGTTGSGRYLTGDFIGADIIQNEITAQARAAIARDLSVDTIFEIGGQDSKYIRIENGVVVDFEMNKVCAAGTGSFLEEQAEKLNLNIVEEFGTLALAAEKPSCLGDRCTVFMESNLNSHQQKGVTADNLVGGLAYSIVQNYIQKVVGHKPIGNRIFFQGGVANNRAVIAAFKKVTGKEITVPPHFDVTGAIGAAMLARESMKEGEQTRFKGFQVSRVPFSLSKFTCNACSNQCEIRRVRIEGEKKPLFYGGRCERYEVPERKNRGKGIPNLFEEKMKLLLEGYEEQPGDSRTTIGIPRILTLFFQQFPFWRTFFEELGFRVVLSRESDRKLVTRSLEMLAAETCLPVEVVHGHVFDLMERDVDWIFTPFIVNAGAGDDHSDGENPTVNYNCPWVQSYPFMIRGTLRESGVEKRLLIPTLHFKYRKLLERELSEFMEDKFGFSRNAVIKALDRASKAQSLFERKVADRGKAVLESLPRGRQAFVILGRSYNTGDAQLNLSLVEKLINLDVLPIPIDFLPLSRENVFDDYPMMYWPGGQNIIAAAKIAARDERLHAVYLGNFRCGPDSFLAHYVKEEIGGKPFLHLEVDEHSADAGMITRCEAFLDSLRGSVQVEGFERKKASVGAMKPSASTDRVLYFPYMNDGAYALAAASRSCGIEAEVLPMQGERDIELGRRYTSSRECFPMICTLGSFLRKMFEPGFDPKRSSFFMPAHNGPCRFGQYRKLDRIIFDRLGFEDVQIVSPSNENAYAELSGGRGPRFRIAAWKGIVASDLLKQLLREKRPYEAVKGETDRVYRKALDEVVRCVEKGAGGMEDVIGRASEAFQRIELMNGVQRPLIAIVGEIFMRDNPFCSGYLASKLEELGAECFVAPTREWITYSTYRYVRDSRWKRNLKGLFKAKVQEILQNSIAEKLIDSAAGAASMEKDIHLHDMLDFAGSYVHRDYDGDPVIALGAASGLHRAGIAGVVNILPFTCMPGTLIASVSPVFRKDHGNMPWVNIEYDGQEDSAIEMRLQAFMHQAKEYARSHGLIAPQASQAHTEDSPKNAELLQVGATNKENRT